jgi:4a-hydroxytetrahydrobiopterin dehydratase
MIAMSIPLRDRHCKVLEKGSPALSSDDARTLLAQVHGDWSIKDEGKAIQRSFRFTNYYETIAFVNALAWVAHREDHHPDLEVGYNRCRVRYGTHSVGGLSENDFICAAKLDALSSAV